MTFTYTEDEEKYFKIMYDNYDATRYSIEDMHNLFKYLQSKKTYLKEKEKREINRVIDTLLFDIDEVTRDGKTK